jgi:hypothetical protein
MNNLKIKSFLLILSLFLAVSDLKSGTIISFRRRPRIRLNFLSEYDNNIFLYSPQGLYEFKHQIRPYRFPFQTADDVITSWNLNISLPFLFLKRPTDFLIDYKAKIYTVNSEKTYQIIQTAVFNRLTPKLELQVSYLLIPKYLIRYYRDPLNTEPHYIGCFFREHLFSFSARYRFSFMTINPYFRYEIADYRQNFNFYDGNATRPGIKLRLPITKTLSVTARWERRNYHARGEVPDISSISDNFQSRWQLKTNRRLTLVTELEYELRHYTTTNHISIDPYHRNRTDRKYSFKINASYQIRSSLEIFTEYRYEFRNVSSPSFIDIDEIKNYNNYKMSGGVRFSLPVNNPRPQDEEY